MRDSFGIHADLLDLVVGVLTEGVEIVAHGLVEEYWVLHDDREAGAEGAEL